MSEYMIQHAMPADLPEIVTIYNSTIASRQVTADLVPVQVDDRQQWFKAHGGNRPLYVIRSSQDEILAWGSLSDYYPRDAYHITAEISIYVKEAYRRFRLGKILTNYICTQAPSLGIHNIIALIFSHNVPSIRLFESLGFKQWGYLPQVCDLKTYLADVVIFGKKLR